MVGLAGGIGVQGARLLALQGRLARVLLGIWLPILLALAACNTVQQQSVAFDEGQEAFARKQAGKGTGRVTGHAFFHSISGRTYTAGGDWITLVPATAYAEERMRILYGAGRARSRSGFSTIPNAGDEAYFATTRREKADIHGKFDFENVMPGRWFVVATVRWQTYDRDIKIDIDHGWDIYDDITVKPGETTKVVLSGN